MTVIAPNESCPPRCRWHTHPYAVGAILLFICGAGQLWIITAGFKSWHGYTDYYSRLTDAFLHGQLNLRQGPAPEILSLPDPYDPEANARYRLHDASLYNGKYYLYWGPAPAIFAAAICWIIRDFNPSFGDQYLAFIFLFGATVLAAILIFQARTKLFPTEPVWTSAFAILTLGLGTPLMFMLARSAIYEASVAAGQFFLLAGFLAAWFGLQNRKTFLLVLAGLFWACSAGSRISMMPAVAAVAMLTAWRLRGRDRKSLANISGLLAPLLAGAILHAWYNDTRFGSPTEFGIQYQLAATNQHFNPTTEFSSWRFVLPNFISYLFQPPYPIKLFPYLQTQGTLPIRWLFHLKGTYHSEWVTGIIWAQPFLLFAALAWRLSFRVLNGPTRALGRWLTTCLIAAAVLGFLPALTMNGGTMRYLLDTVPSLAILSAIGFWSLNPSLDAYPRLRREIRTAAILICLTTSLMGLLTGIDGGISNFQTYNEPLFQLLRSHLPEIPW
jgi:hypothetical protein